MFWKTNNIQQLGSGRNNRKSRVNRDAVCALGDLSGTTEDNKYFEKHSVLLECRIVAFKDILVSIKRTH